MASKSMLAGQYPALGERVRCDGDTSQLQRSVSALFRSYRQPVYHYLLSILRNPAAAEDVTQETFLRLFSELREGQHIDNVRGWVFRVGHNLALNRQRDDGKLESLDATAIEPSVFANTDFQQQVLENERRLKMRSSLQQLSDQERRCIELRAEGLLYREIADVLGVRISSVGNYVERAVKKMAKALNV